ncbi:hypothetical protein O0I10_002848 [Lichtheimia ornata]|uniref:tRNA-splicing endonuclease subunit Sen54 N-terminal domain-containing protein n=1 Tax=Lichtheimia ornata TaxID=688661 RepID=A0AAD7Y0J8_9FUNG|nr:uncharacterized protein O0I10_002848 [Lichtheimia ornata]KAJ8661580.1 hypothetical protein O0I10_002848 [Lichtheimia ornata]
MSDSEEDEQRDFSALLHKKRIAREKDNTPDNSIEQKEALDASRNALFTLIGEERRASAKSTSKGIYERSSGLTKLIQPRGIHLRVMGHAAGGKVSLYLEEAAWLVSIQHLQVTDQQDGRELDMQDYYAMVFGGEDGWISFEKYQTYAYLRRLGYIVRRTPPPMMLPSPSTTRPSHSIFWSFIHRLAQFFRHVIIRLFGTRPLGSLHSPLSVLRIIPSTPWYRPFTLESNHHHRQPQFHYDVYKPNPNWKKRDPGVPDFRIVVTGARDAVPTMMEYQQIFTELNELPSPSRPSYPRIRYTRNYGNTMTFLIAVVDDAEGVSFMRISGDGAQDLSLKSSS